MQPAWDQPKYVLQTAGSIDAIWGEYIRCQSGQKGDPLPPAPLKNSPTGYGNT